MKTARIQLKDEYNFLPVPKEFGQLGAWIKKMKEHNTVQYNAIHHRGRQLNWLWWGVYVKTETLPEDFVLFHVVVSISTL